MAPDADLLGEVVRRLVAALAPERIVLFGSRARGEHADDSDWDVAVVARSDLPWHERERIGYRSLRGLAVPVELVVLTPEELRADLRTRGSLARRLRQEGRVLYDVREAA